MLDEGRKSEEEGRRREREEREEWRLFQKPGRSQVMVEQGDRRSTNVLSSSTFFNATGGCTKMFSDNAQPSRV